MALFDQTSSDEEKRQFTAKVAYPLWISEKDAHFEKSTSNGDKCLTIKGIAQYGGPASILKEPVAIQNSAWNTQKQTEIELNLSQDITDSRESLGNGETFIQHRAGLLV